MNQKAVCCCENGHGAGIVSANAQQMNHIYPAQTAILRGTLYPELDKPLAKAASPSNPSLPTMAQAMNFAAWEMRLYLDTHPEDPSALQLYQQLCRQMAEPGYACAFIPCGGKRWAWTDDPWPWEYEANGRGN